MYQKEAPVHQDNRRVVLIKSLTTNNRFYALVDADSEIRNADAVEKIPDNLLLGIAYPCLEDGLNDFAVIRTTFETLELFDADDPIRDEMMEIINDARGNLMRRLVELHDKIAANLAHFLGTDYEEFKSYAMDIVRRGYPRRNLDSMMKLNVFSSVAMAEGHADTSDLLYHFEFSYAKIDEIGQLPARDFIVALFDEVMTSVRDDGNYATKYLFDKNVFQKFIAVMFVNYATTDPVFYGINRKDYGVSGEKSMDDTPLYLAIRRELDEIEKRLGGEAPSAPSRTVAPEPRSTEPDFSAAIALPEGPEAEPSDQLDHAGRVSYQQASDLLPREIINEEVLLGPLTSLCSAASLLMRKSDPETQRFARIILADASKLVGELKRLGIIPPTANDPGAGGL